MSILDDLRQKAKKADEDGNVVLFLQIIKAAEEIERITENKQAKPDENKPSA